MVLETLTATVDESSNDAGDANAMNKLGVLYEYGWDGVAQDYGKARQWLRRISRLVQRVSIE